MTEHLHIDVSGDRLESIREAVATGDYASPNDVLEEAMRLWERSRSEEIRRIREMVDAARASGSEPWEGVEAIIAKARAAFEAESHVPYRAA